MAKNDTITAADCLRDNGAYGVLFIQKWESWRDGQQAGFALETAERLIELKYAVWDPFVPEEEREEPTKLPISALSPPAIVRGPTPPDSAHTAAAMAPAGLVPLGAATTQFRTREEEANALLARLKQLDAEEDAEQSAKRAAARKADPDGKPGSDSVPGGGEGDGDPRDKVEIPDTPVDEIHPQTLMKLGRDLSGKSLVTTDESKEIVTAELERRKATK